MTDKIRAWWNAQPLYVRLLVPAYVIAVSCRYLFGWSQVETLAYGGGFAVWKLADHVETLERR